MSRYIGQRCKVLNRLNILQLNLPFLAWLDTLFELMVKDLLETFKVCTFHNLSRIGMLITT